MLKINSKLYDRIYIILLVLPVILLGLAVLYLVSFQAQHGDIIGKDVSLTGGTSVTVTAKDFDKDKIEAALEEEFGDVFFRELSDFRTGARKGFIVEVNAQPEEVKKALEKALGFELTQENSSVEFSGAALSAGFYNQLKNSVFAAFLLMGWTVFLMFGKSKVAKSISAMLTASSISLLLLNISTIKFLAISSIIAAFIYGLVKSKTNKEYLSTFVVGVVSFGMIFFGSQILALPVALALFAIYGIYSVPSLAVIFAALADIVMTVAAVDLLGMKLSLAGVTAFLMLIGYSVDTDILLTTRVLKSEGKSINARIFDAFKTGITMTLTSFAAVFIALLITRSLSETLNQIFTILLLGLGFDIINTWLTNASIIKWYAERHKDEIKA
ncbi:hypothetical protein D6817_04625 [Candidatus Pacearchaeota archaeon]|nr:MAG: hypothetical protein D6817_04625 [Candidatus Pacearchaeota archaeon]